MAELLISPLVGEMSGRTEGGAVPPTCQPIKGKPFDGFPFERARIPRFLHTPLWPAGHLPRKGGDRFSRRLSPTAKAARGRP
ncbi:hypothetical protein FJ957_25275 [Mesorhizobium sp. B2-4-6]|nr:hypothetical protein FJW10_12210 [Mesorhizobium sp. B4-1-1]TPL41362.1 hypothetical protein FJ957_25275 [Mesorhizobium sp. B2-4-6]